MSTADRFVFNAMLAASNKPRRANVRAIIRTTGEHFMVIDSKTFNGAKAAGGVIFTAAKTPEEILNDGTRYSCSCAFVFDAADLPAGKRAELDFRIGNSLSGGVSCLDAAKRFRAAGAKAFKVRRDRATGDCVLVPLFPKLKAA